LLIIPIQARGPQTLLFVCIGINRLLANAVQVSLFALTAHVCPTSMRATGVAYSGTIGRAGGLLSSLPGSSIIQAGAASYWQTLAMAMLCAFAGLACIRNHYPAIGKLED
jgi:AAHS family 4-hydroxybenzoate transporter-like MFS transporter